MITTWEEVRLVETGLYTFRLLSDGQGHYKSEPLPLLRSTEDILLIPKRKLLGIFESKSSPGDKHYVYLETNMEVSCTCWGSRAPDKCWHIRGMREVLKETPAHLITEPIRM